MKNKPLQQRQKSQIKKPSSKLNKPPQKDSRRPTKPYTKNSNTSAERIQKVLARGGMGSRRQIERWIEEQRFTVNGHVVALGYLLKPGDHLQLNGRTVKWEKYAAQTTRVLVYHKPTGEVVSRRDPEGRPVVFTQLPRLPVGRWIAVGRLDINTSGLLLVTNNGELAHRLMHPSHQIEREYAARILGEVDDAMIQRLKEGVMLEDGYANFSDIQFYAGEGANKWFHVVVKGGRNRLVRRLWESQGVTVSRLKRVRYGPAMLPDRIKPHSYYELTSKELVQLLGFVDMPADA